MVLIMLDEDEGEEWLSEWVEGYQVEADTKRSRLENLQTSTQPLLKLLILYVTVSTSICKYYHLL